MIAVSGDAERDTEASGVIGLDISASATGTGNRGWFYIACFFVLRSLGRTDRGISKRRLCITYHSNTVCYNFFCGQVPVCEGCYSALLQTTM